MSNEVDNAKLIYVTGIKGGVGKSFISNLLIYYAKHRLGVNPIVVDADTSSPDVYWCNRMDFHEADGKPVDLKRYDTSSDVGWASLITLASKNKNRFIIVNSPAKEDESIKTHGKFLDKLVERVGIDVISFFVINENGNAIKQVELYRENVHGKICIIKNSGKINLTEDSFKSFNSDQKCADLPSVFIPCETTKYISRHTYEAIDDNKKSLTYLFSDEGEFGYRFMCEEWLDTALEAIGKAIDIAKPGVEND